MNRGVELATKKPRDAFLAGGGLAGKVIWRPAGLSLWKLYRHEAASRASVTNGCAIPGGGSCRRTRRASDEQENAVAERTSA